MSGKEIKKKLHELIDRIDDDDAMLYLLEEDIADYVVNRKKDPLDDLSEAQLAELRQAVKEVEEGKVISFEAFKTKLTK